MRVVTTTPSRRTVLRATAWSVPSVSIVAAAPAFAASTPGPTGFRVNAAPTPGLYANEQVRWLAIGAHNPTTAPLSITIFLLDTSDPVPWEVAPKSWTWGGYDGSSFFLTATVAPLSDSTTFDFGWHSAAGMARDVTLTATAAGQDPATSVISLRFDQPLPAARRAAPTDQPTRSPLPDH